MPGPKQYIGNTDFTLQPVSSQFVEGQGWNTTETYVGSNDKLSQFLAEIIVFGAVFGGVNAVRINADGLMSIVEVTYARSPYAGPGQANPIEDPITRTWTLTPNYNQVDIMNLPQIQNGFRRPDGVWVPGLSTFSIKKLADFKRTLNRVLSGDLSPNVNPQDLFDPKTMPALIAHCKLREETIAEVPQYVLKKVEVVTSKSQITAAHEKVGLIHNSNALTIAEPTLLKALLIDPLNLVRKKVGEQTLNWLKMAPTIEQLTGGKYQISQEYYSFERFDPYIYHTVSPKITAEHVFANYGQRMYDW